MCAQNLAWTDRELTNPHAVADKATRVKAMFTAIAPRYDLNNRVHSLGRDQAWRRRVVALSQLQPDETVLDVACGTGDLALAFARAGARRVLGQDLTYGMLEVAKGKRAAASRVAPTYQASDAMRLPIADASVDLVSIAFGIRNVADPAKAIGEFHRVLRPGGRLLILEFSQPNNAVARGLYSFYFNRVMPRTASLIARDRTGAYRYLPRSVNTFLDRQALARLMDEAGFAEVLLRPLTLGIAVIYRGAKQA